MFENTLKLMKNGTEFLGSKYSILGGGMTWISEAGLVSAISNAGAFGVLASGASKPEHLDDQIKLTKNLTKNPFGVNVILAHRQLDELLEVCSEHSVSHIILAGGVVSKDIIDKVHRFNCKAIGISTALTMAKRMIKNGIDGLILEGSEAGGHVGNVSTLILIQEILLEISEFPIFVAGGIARGEIVASLLKLGAFGVQIGTLFACVNESIAHENFKNAFFKASARDSQISLQLNKNFPISAVRSIENSATDDFLELQKSVIEQFKNQKINVEDGRFVIENFWAGALRKAVVDGDVDRGSLMSGQAVGFVKSGKNASEVINELLIGCELLLSK